MVAGEVDLHSLVNRAHALNRDLAAWLLSMPDSRGGLTLRNFAKPFDAAAANGVEPVGASGRPGGSGAMRFDGTDDFVSIADSAAVDVETVSVSAWVRVTALAQYGNPIIEKWNKTVTPLRYPYSLRVSELGKAQLVAYDGSNVPIATGTTTVSGGGWWHLTGTRLKGSRLRIYVNGVLETEVSDTATGNSLNGLAVCVGGRGGTPTPETNFIHAGDIDDVRIVSRELSDTHVYEIFRQSRIGYGDLVNRKAAAVAGFNLPSAFFFRQFVMGR